MIFIIGTAFSILELYGELIDVEGETALHIIFVIQIESRCLNWHMFKGASLASTSIRGGHFMLKVQSLKCSIIDGLYFEGRL